jgi:hypothetical protein
LFANLDIQSLSITITSSRNKNEIQFIHSTQSESTINTNDFQQQQEWNLYSHVEVSKKYIYDAWNKHERPCFTISSTISRRPGYYLYNAYMLIFLISILGFVPFSISCTLPHFRISTTCLLILSSINFRWIVTQKLPTVSYLTTLDKYAIGALIFLVCLCVWHAFIGSELFMKFKPDTVVLIDTFVLILIGLFYFLFHLVYIIHFLLRHGRYKLVGLTPEFKLDTLLPFVDADKGSQSPIDSPKSNHAIDLESKRVENKSPATNALNNYTSYEI